MVHIGKFLSRCVLIWLLLVLIPARYHLSMHRNAGSLKRFETEQGSESHMVPASLLPGVVVKGAAVTMLFGDNSMKSQIEKCLWDFQGLHLNAPEIKSALLADTFASVSFTAQHGSFQKLFFDLTRFQANLDFPSGTKLLSGSLQLAQDFLNSQTPSLKIVQSVCPNTTVSLQQQGPFSFRVDSRIQVDLKDRAVPVRVGNPVFAIEYTLQVLGSAKAIAWYSSKSREFMVELRCFEM